jgi:hypothetical protein
MGRPEGHKEEVSDPLVIEHTQRRSIDLCLGEGNIVRKCG